MAWYKNGTIAISGVTVTGTGTNWADNKSGIGPGQALLVPASGTVKMYEILRVDSATKLTLTSVADTVAAGSAYAIMSFYTDSVPDFARRLSAQLSYYQTQMDGWQQIMTSTGSITLEAPDGTQVTLSSFKKLTSDMSNKADLAGGAVAIGQGGTGAKDIAGARLNLGVPPGQIAQMCSAWVMFNGYNGSIMGAFNVSSVTRSATGIYTVNLVTPLTTNFAVSATGQAGSGSAGASGLVAMLNPPTLSSISLIAFNSSWSGADPAIVCMSVLGGR